MFPGAVLGNLFAHQGRINVPRPVPRCDCQPSDFGEQRLTVSDRVGGQRCLAKEACLIDQLPSPLRDLGGAHVIFRGDPIVFPSANASRATLALKCGMWFRGILLMMFSLLG